MGPWYVADGSSIKRRCGCRGNLGLVGRRRRSLSSGLHHARYETGAGFCTFNGLVIAAKRALRAGAQSVLIVDLDAHCGGGTHLLIEADERVSQLDVSVSDFDNYEPAERSSLDIITDAKDYIEMIERRLNAIGAASALPELCIYNAGMDPDERCVTGRLEGIDADMLARREEIVFEWCRAQHVPVAFVVAGGYVGGCLDQEDLVNLHRLTISAAH